MLRDCADAESGMHANTIACRNISARISLAQLKLFLQPSGLSRGIHSRCSTDSLAPALAAADSSLACAIKLFQGPTHNNEFWMTD